MQICSGSTAAYDSLSGIEEIKLMKSGSIEYEQGVVVMPAYLAKKGIEFDSVIIYDTSVQDTVMRACADCSTPPVPGLRITCSFTVYRREPSPFLRNVPPESVLLSLT